ncbi:M48 family metalloprotease [Campylobacter armoricus]|uniref:M48 family metalloprotease n=1 Tax=Campylobacter armoricus TaxID=2505970 RepID=UPI0011165CA5|nr:M48 family metalloprotease [Campylobacter armoricus]
MLKQIINIFILLLIVLVLLIIIITLEQSADIIIEKILPILKYLLLVFEELRQNSIVIDTFYFIANNLFISLCFVFISFLVILIMTHFILGKQSKLKGDIYELQNISKFKILWLNLLFFALLFFIILLSYSLILKVFYIFTPEFYESREDFSHHIPYTYRGIKFFDNRNYEVYHIISFLLSFFVLMIIFFAYLIKVFIMKNKSIDKLAKILEAREISLDRKNLTTKEKNALFAIEEMAIASSMPLPRVFIMLKEKGINALCTGERFGKKDEKIAIFITKGALNFFNKEELQAVIGHEFSHAFHKDVALNLKLFSLIFALNCISLIGDIMLRGLSKTNTSKSKDRNKALAVLGAIALVFFILGALGTLFARILQASISRQKEYLADVSSVQYTRNPQALINALKKLILFQKKTNINNTKAKDCAHMFFLKAFDGILATHPSLEKRIKYLEKHFGSY